MFGDLGIKLAAQTIIKILTSGDEKKRARVRHFALEIFKAIKFAYADDEEFQ